MQYSHSDGSRTITFRNGTVKEIATDGQITVRYINGDVKEEISDGTVTYYYNDTRTVRAVTSPLHD